jgi:hypothetical protein
MARVPGRDTDAVLARLAAPLALAAVLVPFRGSFPNTDAALALVLAVGIAVTEIAVRGRRHQAAAARRAAYLDGINAAARAAATGAEPQPFVEQVCGQLTGLLGLSVCRFQDGAAGIGNPPRLLRDGRIVTAGQTWDAELAGLPSGRDTELLARAAGCCRAGSCSLPVPAVPAWSSGWPLSA